MPISKRSYLLLSLLGFAALASVHWIHSWPALSQGHSFPDLGDSPAANPFLEVLQTITLFFLFGIYLYCLVNWERLQFTAREVVWSGIAQGSLAWIALPANSTDIFGYIGLGRIAGIYGANPYLHTYSEFADFYFVYMEWDIPMPYGPVLLPFCILGGWIAQHSVLIAVFVLKLVLLLTHGVNCRLLYLILKGWDRAPVFGMFLFGLNPLLLLEQIANGHNDGVMILFALLAILALQRRSDWWHVAAIVFALLSALVKLPGLFLCLVVVVYLARNREWRALSYSVSICAALLLTLGLTLFPTRAALLSLTNAGNYTKNSLHSIVTVYGEKLSDWIGASWDYDTLYVLDRRVFSVLFFGFCLWRLSKIFELNDLVGELAYLFLALLTGYAAWFFPWYVAWLLPLAAFTESLRLRWAIVAFSCSALALYAFPYSLLEPPTTHWFLFPLRLAIVHLAPVMIFLCSITWLRRPASGGSFNIPRSR
ncbi:MAG: hypothetical protein ABIU20_01070 [Blastocatellia bacterium]